MKRCGLLPHTMEQKELRIEKCALGQLGFCDLGKQKPVPRGSEKILREEKEPQQTKKLWGKKNGSEQDGGRTEEGMRDGGKDGGSAGCSCLLGYQVYYRKFEG